MAESNKVDDGMGAYRAAVRAKGLGITPYRLGVAVGEAHAFTPSDEPSCPYTHPKSRGSYLEGVKNGIRWAHEALAADRFRCQGAPK